MSWLKTWEKVRELRLKRGIWKENQLQNGLRSVQGVLEEGTRRKRDRQRKVYDTRAIPENWKAC